MRRVMEDRPLDPVTVECVVKRDNMLSAWNQVKANKGAPGIDGITIEEFTDKTVKISLTIPGRNILLPGIENSH